MTPKEKAFDLILKFQHPLSEESDTDCLHIKVAKEFAFIAVDEILQSLGHKKLGDSPYTTLEARQYYVQVKQEIEKL
jgi:hypothetical protein